MIKLLSYIFIFLCFACKKSNPESNILISSSTNLKKSVKNEKIYETCEELIISLVRSSNAVALTSFKKVQIRIDNITSEKIIIELFVADNISDDSSIKKISENPVAWIEFFPATKKLDDITNDPDNPILLKYDSEILKNADLFALCGFKNSNVVNNKNEVKCYRVENGDYSFKNICEYSENKDFNFMHSQIGAKFGQDDLLEKLPKKDTIYSTEATPKITYSIKKDSVKIDVISEGGETKFKIYLQNGKGIIEVVKSID